MGVVSGFREDCVRTASRVGSAIKTVAHPPHINQETRFAGHGLDLFSQIGDMGVDSAVRDEGLPAPNLVQQLVSAQCLAAMANEGSQELKFNRSHLDSPPTSAELASSEIHFRVAESINLRHFPCSPAQCGLNTRAQLTRAEWLGDIVVGSQFQAQYLVRLLRFCR